MWHGPCGLYGWAHDEEKDGPRQHLVNVQAYLHGIPRAFLCRRFGHRPVIDGYGTPGQTWPSGQSRAARWVSCGRCDMRPDWQGNLEPALWPTLGAPYTGEWTTKLDYELAYNAMQQARGRYHTQMRAWSEAGGDPESRPEEPESLLPAWPAASWDGLMHGGDRPGPRGAVSMQLLVWQRKRRDFPGYGAGFSIGAGEQPIKWHVHGGKLGSVYVGFEEYGRAFAHRLLGRDMPETRVFSIDVEPAAATLRWDFAARRHEWRSSDPWWMNGHVNFADLLFGKVSVESHVIDHRDVLIPLPEGRYPARVELIRSLRRRARWPRVTTTYRHDITPACGVPVPGKGESSYDCGDDAYYSSSGPSKGPGYGSEWVTQAVSKFADSVLNTRSRYGSGLDWKPDAGWPEECVRV